MRTGGERGIKDDAEALGPKNRVYHFCHLLSEKIRFRDERQQFGMSLKQFPIRQFNSIIELSIIFVLLSSETSVYPLSLPQHVYITDAHPKIYNKNKCMRQCQSRKLEWFLNYSMRGEKAPCLTSNKGLWKIMVDEILSMGGFAIKNSNEA